MVLLRLFRNEPEPEVLGFRNMLYYFMIFKEIGMKKLFSCLFLMFFAFAAYAQQTSRLGQTGPGGGIIFFDKGVSSDGWQYLEAAATGTEFRNVYWGAFDQNIAGTSTAVGSGKRNTELIVTRLMQLGETGRAAQLCESLNFNGLADWFLPSKDELDMMYRNLKQRGLGGFGDGYYWSSSQGSNYYAWFQSFGNGSQYNYSKNDPYTVRAVRAF